MLLAADILHVGLNRAFVRAIFPATEIEVPDCDGSFTAAILAPGFNASPDQLSGVNLDHLDVWVCLHCLLNGGGSPVSLKPL
jgi:hypothetical protein